jgi:hypothetical protein
MFFDGLDFRGNFRRKIGIAGHFGSLGMHAAGYP